jgi:hypothetical protein
MLVFEGSTWTFDVAEIRLTTDYDLVVRYAHLRSSPRTWESVAAELIRVDGPPDPTGRCSVSAAAAGEGPEIIRLSLPAGQTSQKAAAAVCLEEGQRYQIKLTFLEYDPAERSLAAIYVDSAGVLFVSFLILGHIFSIPYRAAKKLIYRGHNPKIFFSKLEV